MTPTLLYLFGPPGAGKTTLMETLLREWPAMAQHSEPFSFVYRIKGGDSLIELGERRPPFSGTDTLSMSGGPVACTWIAEQPHPRIVAEGDRLAYDGFWLAAQNAGYRMWLVLLDTTDVVLALRRGRRAAAAGAQRQNPQWQRGRASKARRLADTWGDVTRLNANRPVAELAAELLSHPYAKEVFPG